MSDLMLFLEFGKSVAIWRSDNKKYRSCFFDSTVYIDLLQINFCQLFKSVYCFFSQLLNQDKTRYRQYNDRKFCVVHYFSTTAV